MKHAIGVLATLLLVVLRGAAAQTGRSQSDPDRTRAAQGLIEGLGAGEADMKLWTPSGDQAEGFRKADERMWRDSRLKKMDFGPVIGGTVQGFAQGNGQGDKVINARSGLCVRVGDYHDAVVVYEKITGQCKGAWFGSVVLDGTRHGLMHFPGNDAPPLFAHPHTLPWAKDGSFDAPRQSDAFPPPRDWLDWRGVHFLGDRIVLEVLACGVRVLEHPWVEEASGARAIARTFEVAPSDLEMLLRVMPAAEPVFRYFGAGWTSYFDAKTSTQVALIGGRDGASETGRRVSLEIAEGWVVARVAPHASPRSFKLLFGAVDDEGSFESLAALSNRPEPLTPWTLGGVQSWPQVVETSIESEPSSGPYMLDHILPPIDNPWNALCYFAGVDFLPDGRIALCTAYGDVWTVARLDTGRPRWKRFATGLYQPLGLKVLDGIVHVIERGQITRVRDTDGDGEGDFLECFSNRWHSFGGLHCYDMCLEVGLDGAFYFNKSGEWDSPNGASILRVEADGSQDAEVFATGLRHSSALGVTPEGFITSAGQQGTFTPSSRIDLAHKGSFLGLMEGAHRDPPPLLFDEPLLWLPIHLDSSSADQVQAPPSWGPLGGQMLHLSWGQCRVLHVMQEIVGEQRQAAAAALPLPRTLSGPARGRFSRLDGQLYVACLNGWQCRETWDGALERIRFVGGDYPGPVAVKTLSDGLDVTFGTYLDPASLEPRRFLVKQWNYWWSSHYGSDDWSVRTRGTKGRDTLLVERVELKSDGRTVKLSIGDWHPAMQTQVDYELLATDGKELKSFLAGTQHRIPPSPDARSARPLVVPDPAAEPSFTDDEQHNAEVRLRFRASAGARASVFVRWRENGATGYRVDLAGSSIEIHDLWREAHQGDGKDAFPAQPAVQSVPDAGAHLRVNDWNTLTLRCDHRHVHVLLNDQPLFTRIENDTRAPLFGRTGLSLTPGFEVEDASVREIF